VVARRHGVWGILACIVATFAANLGRSSKSLTALDHSLMDPSRRLHAAMIPRAKGTGAFIGLIAGMTWSGSSAGGCPALRFLWHNVIGALTVLAIGLPLSLILGEPPYGLRSSLSARFGGTVRRPSPGAGKPVDLTVRRIAPTITSFSRCSTKWPTGNTRADDITAPIRWLLRSQANASVVMAEVNFIDTADEQVVCDDGPRHVGVTTT